MFIADDIIIAHPISGTMANGHADMEHGERVADGIESMFARGEMDGLKELSSWLDKSERFLIERLHPNARGFALESARLKYAAPTRIEHVRIADM